MLFWQNEKNVSLPGVKSGNIPPPRLYPGRLWEPHNLPRGRSWTIRRLPESTPPSQDLPPFIVIMWGVSGSQNLPLPPRINPPFQQLYATLPEPTPPSQNIPPFQQLCATLPESTPPFQNIPPFQQSYATLPESTPPTWNIPPFSTPICHPLRIYPPPLPEYTPPFDNYMQHSKNLPVMNRCGSM